MNPRPGLERVATGILDWELRHLTATIERHTGISLPATNQMAAILSLPFVDSAIPITSTDPDPGLFGPDSVTWKALREPLLITAVGRAVFLQIAHPLVAEGVLKHSDVNGDPFGRLQRTNEWLMRCAFGTTAEAHAACREVNKLHAAVKGPLDADHATARIPAHTRYRAQDPGLARWVHYTGVDTFLLAEHLLVGRLTETERDRYVEEWNAVARLMGVRERDLFHTWHDVRQYIAHELEHGDVVPGEGSRKLAAALVDSPLGNVLYLGLALLEPGVRDKLGISWGPVQRSSLKPALTGARVIRWGVPRALSAPPIRHLAVAPVFGRSRAGRLAGRDALRTSAIAEFAQARVRGELAASGVA